MDENGVIIFIPYGSRLGFHVGGPASTMANIDYKFPQCVCYEVQTEEVISISGKQQSLATQKNIAATIGANDYKEPQCVCYKSDCYPVVILNDQGGSVMDISNNVTATLRAQEHGHPPVICFEPGIAKREGGADRFVKDKCTTIRANMGDNQPAVCYALEGNGSRPSHRGGGISEEGKMFTLNTIEKHAVCYAIENHPADSRVNIEETGTFQTLSARCGTGGATRRWY